MNTTITSPTSVVRLDLAAFAEQIQSEHQACCTAATTTLKHAMRCGDLLNQAKGEIPHGEFQAWLGDNFPGSKRTAQSYMRLAKNREQVEAKTQSSALLSIGEALEVIAEKPSEQKGPRGSFPDPGDKSFIDPSLPNLDGVTGYIVRGENRKDAQLWVSSEHPGYYFLTIAEWGANEEEVGSSRQNCKPLKLCHAFLSHWLRADDFKPISDWMPIDEPLLSVEEWVPRWPERHELERTMNWDGTAEPTARAADVLREIRDRELWLGCSPTFNFYLKTRFKLDGDGVRAVHRAMDITGGAA